MITYEQLSSFLCQLGNCEVKKGSCVTGNRAHFGIFSREFCYFLMLHSIEKYSLDAEFAPFIGDNYCDSTYTVITRISVIIELIMQKIEKTIIIMSNTK